jgi:hypothetical protein
MIAVIVLFGSGLVTSARSSGSRRTRMLGWAALVLAAVLFAMIGVPAGN